jgi:tRNA(fMet)-specific endonuclease VapC
VNYLFDTNAVIALSGRKSMPLVNRVAASDEGSIAIPAIVAHELFYGAYRSAQTAFNLETLRILFAEFGIVAFDTEDARVAGEIRAALAARGTPIGPYDLLIAGQAKARDLTLVTNNVREFARVEGLRIEDWSSPR